jgi:hypothetical protein
MNVDLKEAAQKLAAKLPNWEEFLSMIENENSQKLVSTPTGYTVYSKYDKTC